MGRIASQFGWMMTGAAVVVLTCAAQAVAGTDPISVPEPTTLGLLSAGVAALTLGARWFRRK